MVRMSKVGTKTVVGRVQPLPDHIKKQINYVGKGEWRTLTVEHTETPQERFARRMRRKDHLASGVLDVFGNHHKDCNHEEKMVIEKYTSGGRTYTTTDLCFGCGSTLNVEHRIPTFGGAPALNVEEIKIEGGYGKFYPSQLTKKIYRALLDLKEEGQSNLPCM